MTTNTFSRGANDTLQDVKHSMSSAQNRYNEIMGTLSLFSAQSDGSEFGLVNTLEMERPVTPIEEEIHCFPATLTRLQKLVRRRIQPQPEVVFVTEEEQRELAGMLMGEVTGIWTDLTDQVDYPFFTYEQNRELNRRVAVHIVTLCADIFKEQLARAEVLRKRNVYSEEANIVRLKVQIVFDARKILNVDSIRRKISKELKTYSGKTSAITEPELLCDSMESLEAIKAEVALIASQSKASFKERMDKKSKASPRHKIHFKSIKEDLKEMLSEMPDLNTEALIPIFQNLPQQSSSLIKDSTIDDTDDPPPATAAESREVTQLEGEDGELWTLTGPNFVQRSSSQPNLLIHRNLLEEWEIPSDTNWFPSIEVDDRLLNHTVPEESELQKEKTLHIGSLTRELLRKDLHDLQFREPLDKDTKDDEDLPPLIQSVNKVFKSENRGQKRQKILADLDEREAERVEEAKFVPREATHPQPATLTKEIGNKVIRTSDIRPSERQCLSEIILSLFGPVWNDLLDQIDPATVKGLDSNLFRGEEIKEVYKEIMKTVSRSHLEFTQDPIVEACAEKLDVSTALASATLRKRKKKDRVINPHLHRSRPSPWGSGDQLEWNKVPVFTPGDKKGALDINSTVEKIVKDRRNDFLNQLANSGDQHRARYPGAPLGLEVPRPCTPQAPRQYVLPMKDFNLGISDISKIMQERLTRNYSSWLTWWKSFFSSEDYTKYLATQETDYLSLIYHMYDSDGEEEQPGDAVAQEAYKKRQLEKKQEHKKKFDALKAEKLAYNPGLWNAQSVLLGGLGQDPQLDESELVVEYKPEELEAINPKPPSRGACIELKPPPGSQPQQSSKSASEVVNERTSARDTSTSQTSTPQHRLEQLWALLKMPDRQRLDMIIKYCDDKHADKLTEALDEWEKTTKSILQRETIIRQLEYFERHASDPNRFFERGYRGSSVARLDEAKTRSGFYEQLETLDDIVKEAVLNLKLSHHDTLTYEGRDYLDKMKWDRIEMLYWLQEDRRTLVGGQIIPDSTQQSIF